MLIVLCTSVLSCVSNFFVFYLFEHQIKYEQTKVKLAFAEKQIAFQADYYKDMSQRQLAVRTLSHDMKNYMSGLMGIIQEGNLNEASCRIGEIIEKIKSADSVFETGHSALDAILQIKKHNMDNLNIRFDTFIALPEHLSVDVLDLCVILGNGLDNAIEAVAKLTQDQDRYIRLVVKAKFKYISIGIENPTEHTNFSKGIPKTTKSDGFYSGLGLDSIQALTAKYDGTLNVSVSNKIFELAAMVKNA